VRVVAQFKECQIDGVMTVMMTEAGMTEVVVGMSAASRSATGVVRGEGIAGIATIDGRGPDAVVGMTQMARGRTVVGPAASRA